MANTEKLAWSQLDTGSLTGKAMDAYKKVQAAQKAAKEAREHFEGILKAAMDDANIIPKGEEPLFSYRFGNLSVAFQAIKAPKGKPAMISLKAARK